MAVVYAPAQIERFKSLLAAGLSLAQAGERLGITLAAACGIAHRLKRKGVALPARKAGPKQQPVIVNDVVRIIETTPTATSLTELGGKQCHWPVAGEGRETLFCGADRNG